MQVPPWFDKLTTSGFNEPGADFVVCPLRKMGIKGDLNFGLLLLAFGFT